MKTKLVGHKHMQMRNFAHSLASLFLMVAVFVRVLVPQGFMLDTSAQGLANSTGVKIILCTAQGELPAIMDESGEISFTSKNSQDQSQHNSEKSDSDNHCNFAGALADAKIDLASFDYVNSNWKFANSKIAFSEIQIGNGLAAPPPPKTGPPILV